MLAQAEFLEDLDELRRRLGPFGFQWLCACAIFPLLRFPLTVHLGEVLTKIANGPIPRGAAADHPGNAPDVDEQRALYQLPWFRSGRIPEGLRRELVSAIHPDLRDQLRAEIETLLRTWSASQGVTSRNPVLRLIGGAKGIRAGSNRTIAADDAILAAFVLGYPQPRRGMAVGEWLGRLLRLRLPARHLTVAAAVVAASLVLALTVAFRVVRPDVFEAPQRMVIYVPGPTVQAGPDARSLPASTPAPVLAAGSMPGAFQAFRDCPDCLDMVALPGGTFTMGSPKDEPGRNEDESQVSVTLPGFAISRFPVTRGQYAAFVAATGRATSLGLCDLPDEGFSQEDNHPVVCVDWDDAVAYAAWMTKRTTKFYRLLSEAEYEYANRAGTKTTYFWGSEISDGCTFSSFSFDLFSSNLNKNRRPRCIDVRQTTTPVGSFSANEWGLYDTSGNVWSWTSDCGAVFHLLNPGTWANITGGNCSLRVVRGGSWSNDPQYLRSAYRGGIKPTSRFSNIGFRLARTLSPPSP